MADFPFETTDPWYDDMVNAILDEPELTEEEFELWYDEMGWYLDEDY